VTDFGELLAYGFNIDNTVSRSLDHPFIDPISGGGSLSQKPSSLRIKIGSNTALLMMIRLNRVQCPSMLVQPRPFLY